MIAPNGHVYLCFNGGGVEIIIIVWEEDTFYDHVLQANCFSLPIYTFPFMNPPGRERI